MSPSSEGLAFLTSTFGTPRRGHCLPQPLLPGTEAAASAACPAGAGGGGCQQLRLQSAGGAEPERLPRGRPPRSAGWTQLCQMAPVLRTDMSEGWRVPRTPGPAPGGESSPRAEEVLPAWWLFSSCTPGVAGRWMDNPGREKVVLQSFPTLLVSCVISSPGF